MTLLYDGDLIGSFLYRLVVQRSGVATCQASTS